MEPKDDLNVESVEDGQGVVGTWTSCLLYCAFSFGFFYYALTQWREPAAILISGFFAAWGVVYIVVAIRHTIGRATFGDVKLLLERPQPSIGGRITGSLTVPQSAMRASTLVAELSCEKETFGGGDKGDTMTETIWCGKHAFPLRRKPGGGSAAIAIDIPANLEPTTARPEWVTWSSGQPPKIFWSWMLRVTVDLPGVDLDRSYPVTVLPLRPGAAPAAPAAAAAMPKIQAAPATALRQEAVLSSVPVEVRAEEESREQESSAVWVLVAANLVAIAGAIFWGWAVQDIVFLYWIENLVIGAFNIPRILLAEPDQTENAKRGIEMTPGEKIAAKAMFAAFFLVHYGGFCLGHGEVLVSLFPGQQRGHGLFETIAAVLRERGMWLAVLAIVVSRGYSFMRNYVGRREYEGVSFPDLMTRPYKRIFVTHLFIIVGGFVLQAMKLPVAALVVFIALKIGADAYFHRAEREALA